MAGVMLKNTTMHCRNSANNNFKEVHTKRFFEGAMYRFFANHQV